MLQDVNESAGTLGLVYGRPVGDILHPVLIEEFCGVLAEARQQFPEFSWRCMIDPQFIDAR